MGFNRSSHLKVFCKKGVLKYLAKFTGKLLHRNLFQVKLQVVNLQFHLKRGSCIDAFCEFFKNLAEQLFNRTTERLPVNDSNGI